MLNRIQSKLHDINLSSYRGDIGLNVRRENFRRIAPHLNLKYPYISQYLHDYIYHRTPLLSLLNAGVIMHGDLAQPTVMTTLKYHLDGTLLSTGGVGLSTIALDIIRILMKNNFQLDPHSGGINCGGYYIPVIQPPDQPSKIADTISLFSGTYSCGARIPGDKLYQLVKDGLLGITIKLAPGIRWIQIDKSYITWKVLIIIKYLSNPLPVRNRDKFQEASRYLQIEELADPYFQAYMEYTDPIQLTASSVEFLQEASSLIVKKIDDPIHIYLKSYDYMVTLSRKDIQTKLYGSLLNKILEMDSRATEIYFIHPCMIPEVLNGLRDILATEDFGYSSDFIQSVEYLGLPQLRHPVLPALSRVLRY